MRYTFTFLMLALVSLASCSKNSQDEMVLTPAPASAEVIEATVAANSGYELKLDKYGTVRITRQATHFLESTAGIDSKTGVLMYKYVPAAGFRGVDEVVLSSAKTSTGYSGTGGCNTGYSNPVENTQVISYITIRLNVTD